MRVMWTIAASALLAATLGGHALAADTKAGSLTISQPWSRATPGGATTAVGYVTITNTGDQPDRLQGATAEVAAKVSPHSMTMTNGVMEMRELPGGVAIPPHGTVALKPGGLHLMFEGLKHPLRKGDGVPGTLVFDKAGTVPVTFDVQALGATKPASGMKGMPMN